MTFEPRLGGLGKCKLVLPRPYMRISAPQLSPCAMARCVDTRARVVNKDKKRMLKGVPQGAKYLRDCLTKHFKLALEQDQTVFESIAAEPIWHNTRFTLPNVSKKKIPLVR